MNGHHPQTRMISVLNCSLWAGMGFVTMYTEVCSCKEKKENLSQKTNEVNTTEPPPADTENKGNGKIDRIIMENNRNKAQRIYQFPKLSRQHSSNVLCLAPRECWHG